VTLIEWIYYPFWLRIELPGVIQPHPIWLNDEITIIEINGKAYYNFRRIPNKKIRKMGPGILQLKPMILLTCPKLRRALL
jgi:hypothetical protein